MKLVIVTVASLAVSFLSACSLDPVVPEGFPALKFGDGAHGIWKHADTARDIVARVGIINAGGTDSLLITEDAGKTGPSIDLRFPKLEKGSFETNTGSPDPLVIETDATGALWGDNQEGGHMTLSIDETDGIVFAGSFSGSLCNFDATTEKLTCDEITGGKFSTLDSRSEQ